MLMKKTATECWNILKYEIESIIDKFVPLKKQGKRSRKKHLSKEAIRKIVCVYHLFVHNSLGTIE